MLDNCCFPFFHSFVFKSEAHLWTCMFFTQSLTQGCNRFSFLAENSTIQICTVIFIKRMIIIAFVFDTSFTFSVLSFQIYYNKLLLCYSADFLFIFMSVCLFGNLCVCVSISLFVSFSICQFLYLSITSPPWSFCPCFVVLVVAFTLDGVEVSKNVRPDNRIFLYFFSFKYLFWPSKLK